MFAGTFTEKLEDLKDISFEKDENGNYQIVTNKKTDDNVSLNISKKEFKAGLIGFGVAFILKVVMK